jgi:hypothetical protein
MDAALDRAEAEPIDDEERLEFGLDGEEAFDPCPHALPHASSGPVAENGHLPRAALG